MSIELNEGFQRALHWMEETRKPVLVTGRAGTGKSTLLDYFRKTTRKRIAVLAPTGVAAVNIRGQTLHSFFCFRPDVTPHTAQKITPRDKALYKQLDAIVIDEISMVRADLLDCVDVFLRRHGRRKKVPFGGIQMIFIGDLYQLPPVVTAREKQLFEGLYPSPYFFDARVFRELDLAFVELEKVYRQRDDRFLQILNAIRNKTITEAQLAELNQRCQPDFDPQDACYIHLTPTNRLAAEINARHLDRLPGKKRVYVGGYTGAFETDSAPAPERLELKKGAQVMLLNNDSQGRWINGSLGVVVEMESRKDEVDRIWVELETGDVVDVYPYTWEMFEFVFDRSRGTLLSDVVGTYTQYPLRLAWAITIHKSQGLTFDRVILDIGRGTFSHGQVYVALSRCRTLEGLVLKRPLQKKHIWMDRRVVQFLTSLQYALAEKDQSLEERWALLEQALREGRPVEIVYLKAKDEKSRRVVIPLELGERDYQGRGFLGLRAYCTLRQEERVFNIQRILEVQVLNDIPGAG